MRNLPIPAKKIAKSAVVLANELRAPAIVTLIRRGSFTRNLSWLRPKYSTIYAIGQSETVARQLTLNWGVVPIVMPLDPVDLDANVDTALKRLLDLKHIRKGSTVVVVSFLNAGNDVIDAVQMRMV